MGLGSGLRIRKLQAQRIRGPVLEVPRITNLVCWAIWKFRNGNGSVWLSALIPLVPRYDPIHHSSLSKGREFEISRLRMIIGRDMLYSHIP